jgi:hypothetical protein
MSMQPAAFDHIANEPPVLDASMKPADLAFVLQNLRFRNGTQTVKLDREVRDYLVRAVTRQAERTR